MIELDNCKHTGQLKAKLGWFHLLSGRCHMVTERCLEDVKWCNDSVGLCQDCVSKVPYGVGNVK